MYTSWEKSKSKSKSKFDPSNPTNSSSFLNKFNKSLKTHPTKSYHNEDINLYTSSTTSKTPKHTSKTLEDEKMWALKRACLVEKWMEKKVSDKVISREEKNSTTSTLLEEFDLHDTTFFSSSTTNTTTSSSSDDIDYSLFSHPKQNNLATCFAPPRPKPIKTTHSNNSKFFDKDDDFIKNRSMAAKVYSNLKTLKQPISPGVRLTSFINSLFTKDSKTRSNKSSRRKQQQQQQQFSMSYQSEVSSNNISSSTKTNKHMNTEETTAYSTCSSASSFSRSCLMSKKHNKLKDDDHGIKRTVRFCPVSVIVDDDSQACGYKSLQEESDNDVLLNSKFKRSLSKRYQELKRLNGLEKDNDNMVVLQQKKLEEVALDLLSGYSYWDGTKLNNKSHDLIKGHNNDDDDYRVDHGVIYAQHENQDEDEDDDDDDDGFSCSSSDLFELDHLSLMGNELPVYETTQFDNKIM